MEHTVTVDGTEMLLREYVGRFYTHGSWSAFIAVCNREDVPGLERNYGAFTRFATNQRTSFFRDELRMPFQRGIAGLLRELNRPVKSLSLPCGNGKEAYSLAMLAALDGVSDGASRLDMVVDGRDINPDNIEQAQRARYWLPKSHRRSLTSYAPHGAVIRTRSLGPSRFQISDRFRERVSFTQHDIVKDPLVAIRDGEPVQEQYDLVVALNFLLHLSDEGRGRALTHLTDALQPQGLLLVDTNYQQPRQWRALGGYGRSFRANYNGFIGNLDTFTVEGDTLGLEKLPICGNVYWKP